MTLSLSSLPFLMRGFRGTFLSCPKKSFVNGAKKVIWEKGGKKGEDSRRREPPLFLSRISTIGRRTLSLSRCRFWCSHKRNPPGAVVLWTSLLSSSSTLSAKTTKAARRTQSRDPQAVFRKKKEKNWRRIFPRVSLKEIGNGTLSQNRHCDALVDERELQTSSSRVMAQRCVDLSLSPCVCVFLSSLCVRDRYLLVARGGRVILFLYLRLEKKKSPTKTQKTRRLVREKFAHAHCARSFVLYYKHQTKTDHV